MEKKNMIVIGMMVFIILVSSFTSAAAIIGVSPSKISFENVLRGGYAEKIITITASSEEETTVELEARGDILEWLNVSEKTFTVSKDSPHYITLSITPDIDLQNDNYTGFLRLRSSSNSGGQGKSGATGKVVPVLDLFMNVQITDTEFLSCIARNYKVNSVEEREDLTFKANVLNTGNVRLNPIITIDIWDQEQIEILQRHEYANTQVFPTTEKDLEITVPTTGLEIGQYWAEISSLDCFSQATLTFDVLEEGSLRADGSLKELKTKTWIDKGDTTLVEALFSNTGEKDVTAYFKGRVTLGDKTIQLIETEQTRVSIGDTETFPFFFTATREGRYLVSGRVFYDNKRTYEKSAVVNARGSGVSFGTIAKYVFYILLISGIIFLTYKIRQEKKKYKRDLRRFKHK